MQRMIASVRAETPPPLPPLFLPPNEDVYRLARQVLKEDDEAEDAVHRVEAEIRTRWLCRICGIECCGRGRPYERERGQAGRSVAASDAGGGHERSRAALGVGGVGEWPAPKRDRGEHVDIFGVYHSPQASALVVSFEPGTARASYRHRRSVERLLGVLAARSDFAASSLSRLSGHDLFGFLDRLTGEVPDGKRMLALIVHRLTAPNDAADWVVRHRGWNCLCLSHREWRAELEHLFNRCTSRLAEHIREVAQADRRLGALRLDQDRPGTSQVTEQVSSAPAFADFLGSVVIQQGRIVRLLDEQG